MSVASAAILSLRAECSSRFLAGALTGPRAPGLLCGVAPLRFRADLLEASRRGRLSAADRLIGFEFLMGLRISVIPDAAAAALFRLADEDRLSIYDSAYLALALERRAQLATADKRLAEVARKRGILWGERSKA